VKTGEEEERGVTKGQNVKICREKERDIY